MKGGNIPMVELAFLAELSAVEDASGVAGVSGDDSSSVVRCASSLAGTLSLVSSDEGAGAGAGAGAVSVKAIISRCSRTDQISCGVVIVVILTNYYRMFLFVGFGF